MSGTIIPILSKQRFEYSFLGTTASQIVTLQPAIEAISYDRVTLLIRVHRISITSGQSFLFALRSTLPSEEDPQEFTDTTAGGDIAPVTISSTATAPSLQSATATAIPPFLKFILTVSQGTTSGATLYGEFSAALLMREQ
jgi:hypothetical protein